MKRSFPLLLPLLAACQEPPPAVPSPPPPTPSASALPAPPPPPAPALPAVEAAHLTLVAPPPVNVDGAFSEWPASTKPSLQLAVGPKGVAIALRGVQAPHGGLVIALAASVGSVPSIGWYERANNVHAMSWESCKTEQTQNGPDGSMAPGKPLPPEVVAACRKIVVRQLKDDDAFLERFVTRLQITAAGIQRLDAAGRAAPVPGAKLAWNGGAFEASLPASALPRMTEVPLKRMHVAVAPGAAARLHPDAEDIFRLDDEGMKAVAARDAARKAWKRFKLPVPVAFQPHAALRQAVHKAYVGNHHPNTLVSYHPTEPNHVELASGEGGPKTGLGGTPPDVLSIGRQKLPLFTPLHADGDLKIGTFAIDGVRHLVSLKHAHVHTAIVHDIRKVLPRAGTLHVMSYYDGAYGFLFGGASMPPLWNVLAVAPDATIKEVSDQGVDIMGRSDAWDGKPTVSHNADHTELTLRGTMDKKPKKVIWRWNAETGRYESRVIPKNQARTL